MKYNIEIWRYHALVDKYESETIEDIKSWFYNSDWKLTYELGDCCFYVYEQETEMCFEELNKYGFYD